MRSVWGASPRVRRLCAGSAASVCGGAEAVVPGIAFGAVIPKPARDYETFQENCHLDPLIHQ